MSEPYAPKAIEARWQRRWEADGLYRVAPDPSRPKFYFLTMYPYPSGDLHIGHWYAMAPSDCKARYLRMRGYDVLFPIGFDAFGLPAENAAIQHGIHPYKWTMANIERMRGQLRSMGAMFDWSREVVTCRPEYYKWNQWFFLKFYDAGLAYRAMAAVDWCPRCNTTLAREQVVGAERVCERCGTPVIKKDLEQWFFRITKYAEELLDFSKMDWPERVATLQRNWIGRSEGTEVVYTTEQGDPITVFTTRPDTLFGATFLVLAPEHPLVEKLTTPEHRAEVAAYVHRARRQSRLPLRQEVQAPGARGGGAARLGRQASRGGLHRRGGPGEQRALRRPPERGGAAPHHGGPRAGRAGPAGRHLPAPGLAHQPAAVLGDAHPHRLLSRLRDGARALPGPPRAAPRGRGVRPDRGVAAPARRALPEHHLPPVRRPGAAGDRHHGHLRGLLLVPVPVPEPPRPGPALRPRGGALLAPGGPVHRRHRARRHAPPLHAVLHQGDARPGARGLRRAHDPPVQPGDHPRPRREPHEQVPGQRRQPRRLRGDHGGRHGAGVPHVHRAVGRGRPLEPPGDRGRPPVPPPGVAPGPRPGPGRTALPGAGGRPRGAAHHPPDAQARDRGPGGVPVQHGPRGPHGVHQRPPPAPGRRRGLHRRVGEGGPHARPHAGAPHPPHRRGAVGAAGGALQRAPAAVAPVGPRGRARGDHHPGPPGQRPGPGPRVGPRGPPRIGPSGRGAPEREGEEVHRRQRGRGRDRRPRQAGQRRRAVVGRANFFSGPPV